MVTASLELAAAERLGLPDGRADAGRPDAYVRIRAELVSGRRFARRAPLAAVMSARVEAEH